MKKQKGLNIEEINVILPQRLKQFREENELSLREVAEKINKSPSQISFWEKGINPPNCMDLFKLCLIYNISLVDLFPELSKEIKPNRQEIELLENYRKADNDVKSTIKKILEFTKK